MAMFGLGMSFLNWASILAVPSSPLRRNALAHSHRGTSSDVGLGTRLRELREPNQTSHPLRVLISYTSPLGEKPKRHDQRASVLADRFSRNASKRSVPSIPNSPVFCNNCYKKPGNYAVSGCECGKMSRIESVLIRAFCRGGYCSAAKPVKDGTPFNRVEQALRTLALPL